MSVSERLDAIRQRVEKASPAPWLIDHDPMVWGYTGPMHVEEHDPTISELFNEHDAYFVAKAREDVPWLLGELSRALDRADKAEKALCRANEMKVALEDAAQVVLEEWNADDDWVAPHFEAALQKLGTVLAGGDS